MSKNPCCYDVDINSRETYVVDTNFNKTKHLTNPTAQMTLVIDIFLDTSKSLRKTIPENFKTTAVSDLTFPRGKILVQSQLSR